jgi:hypothetical protein
VTAGDLLLPTFLGIGAPRAGTTRLHDLLASHPDVVMPSKRKELNFFDAHFHRGPAWYAACFDPPSGGRAPKAVGEITPVYMYKEEVRQRVRTVASIERFVVCLRDPVDLLWSGYRQNSAIFNFRGSLDEFMVAFPHVVANGFYARALRPWFDELGRDRFLLIRFDDIAHRPDRVRDQLAEFLDLPRDRFPADHGPLQRNQAFTPRFPHIHSLANRAKTHLYRADKAWVVDLAKRVGLQSIVKARARGEDEPELSAERRAELGALYADDLQELEAMTGMCMVVEDQPSRAD